MDSDFNAALCKQKHDDEGRRILMLEECYKSMTDKHDKGMEKIFKKFDEVSDQMLRRLPPWATLAITVLGALVSGLGVALFGVR